MIFCDDVISQLPQPRPSTVTSSHLHSYVEKFSIEEDIANVGEMHLKWKV